MKEGIEKLLRKLIKKKYPMYLDVYIRSYIEGSLRTDNPFNKERYEVYLVIDNKDKRGVLYDEIWNYVRDIGSYMNVEVMGVYQVINDE